MLGLTFGILGHSYSAFLRFKGGKAVAVAMGGIFVLMPVVTIIGALLWAAVFRLTRYVSLASLIFAISLPVVAIVWGYSWSEVFFVLCLCLFILVRHHENIRRLFQGTENRFKRKHGHENIKASSKNFSPGRRHRRSGGHNHRKRRAS